MQHEQIIKTLETQLNNRLEKLWRVFSWCSGILTSIIAGIFVLNKTKNVAFTMTELFIISAVIIILTLFAWLMIKENLRFEGKIRDQIDKLMSEELNYPAYKELRPDKAVFGYKHVVLLLGLAALATTWIEFLIKCN